MPEYLEYLEQCTWKADLAGKILMLPLVLQTSRNQWKSNIKADFFNWQSYFKFVKLQVRKYLLDQDHMV